MACAQVYDLALPRKTPQQGISHVQQARHGYVEFLFCNNVWVQAGTGATTAWQQPLVRLAFVSTGIVAHVCSLSVLVTFQ